jgi:hypothetical protein
MVGLVFLFLTSGHIQEEVISKAEFKALGDTELF